MTSAGTNVFCTSCGSQLNDSDLFCQDCGQSTKRSHAEPTETIYPPVERLNSEATIETHPFSQPPTGYSVGDAGSDVARYICGVTAFANFILLYPIWFVTLSFPTPGVPTVVVIISTLIMILSGLLHWKLDK